MAVFLLMVKPIPRHLLPDTVIFEEFEEDGRYGEGYKAPVTLSFVRVEELTSRDKSNLSDSLQHTHKLYFDVVNSISDAPFNFVVKSKVTFNNQVLVVQKVNPIKAFTLHHYEIELV